MKILTLLYRGLLITFLILGLLFIGGTIYGVFFRTAPAVQSETGPLQASGEREGQIFTNIGRIRVPTSDPEPGMVILFVSFVYYPEDTAFSEELVLRVREFRDITVDYIGSFSAAELQSQGEDHIKAELLRRYNALLRLGQIEALYFSDFIVVR